MSSFLSNSLKNSTPISLKNYSIHNLFPEFHLFQPLLKTTTVKAKVVANESVAKAETFSTMSALTTSNDVTVTAGSEVKFDGNTSAAYAAGKVTVPNGTAGDQFVVLYTKDGADNENITIVKVNVPTNSSTTVTCSVVE